MFRKVWLWSFRNIILSCLILAIFAFGYFLGFGFSNSICNKKCFYKLSLSTTDEVPSYKYHTTLLVLIFSAPRNGRRRNTIRRTWLLTKGQRDISCFFVIGTTSLDAETTNDLKTEANSNSDLLLLSSISDSYSKLSKKLLEAFKWIDKNVKYTFVLKVDDDSFVRLDALVESLQIESSEKMFMGFFDGRARVKVRGKWMEDNWNLCDTYLPYAKGGGYILTHDLVHYLAETANWLTLYKNEDVSLGAWLAPLNIKKVHNPNFDTEYQSRGCYNSYLVTHKQSESMMVNKYENLVLSGNMCATEYRNRLSYVYNWKSLPSLCCIRNNTKIP